MNGLDTSNSFYDVCIIIIVIPANDDVTFSVGQTTGVLMVTGSLDRETQSRYLVTVDVRKI